jgi:hypothetical protein
MAASTSKLNLALCLLLLVSFGLGCSGFRKPWRTYTPKPFDSKEWLAGDRIERGRMTTDLFRSRKGNAKSHEEIAALLGQPDRKATVEGKEVWLYKTDIGIMDALDNLPISFDEKGRSSMGVVRGGTISIGVKDDEL